MSGEHSIEICVLNYWWIAGPGHLEGVNYMPDDDVIEALDKLTWPWPPIQRDRHAKPAEE